MTARILVVDDIEANRRLLQAKLEAQYHTVLMAENGPQALEVARRENPEIILLDVMMPGMDGFEVCQKLKADPATSYIPVVMVTALSEMEDRIKGLAAGAVDFLTKPIDDFLLNSRITALMRYNAVASELRQREASGIRSGAMEELNRDEVDRPSRIFIVDDDARSSGRLANTLRALGHKATTLTEAGEMGDLGAERVDVLILSLFARGFDPLKMIAHFKTNPVTRSISIVLICDPHDRAIALKGLEIGASDMITVPIDRQELAARIRTQTRRTRYIDILRQRVDRGLELSVIDQLTGLHNRRYMNGQLEQHMQRAMRGQHPLSLMMADIDHFKPVNDTHGHQAGDDVLREIGKRLRANVRPTDVVCRTGGEEFVVIMPNTPGDLACAAAERIRKAVAAEEFQALGGTLSLRITVSAGVSTLQGSEDTTDDLMRRADTALYQAKTGGRNRVQSIAA
ncbi:MAG: PleD family two-component system response regulator [Hyphomonas sp.]